jgi:hypothetical protein
MIGGGAWVRLVGNIQESNGFWFRQTMHDGREFDVMLAQKTIVGQVAEIVIENVWVEPPQAEPELSPVEP